jgi:hypothetical protein
MTHLAACPSCQEAADLERLTKQRLASLGAPVPGADLMQRLLALSGGGTQGPVPPRPGYLAGGTGSSSFPAPGGSVQGGSVLGGSAPGGSRPGPVPPMLRMDASTRPPGRRPVPGQSRPLAVAAGAPHRLSRTTRSRLAFAVAGAACLVGVGVAGGVAAGQTPRQVSPPVDSFVVRSGAVPVNLPLDQQAAKLSQATARP